MPVTPTFSCCRSLPVESRLSIKSLFLVQPVAKIGASLAAAISSFFSLFFLGGGGGVVGKYWGGGDKIAKMGGRGRRKISNRTFFSHLLFWADTSETFIIFMDSPILT